VSLRVMVLSRDTPGRVVESRGSFEVVHVPYSGRRSALTLFREARRLVLEEATAYAPQVVHGQGAEAEGIGASAVSQVCSVITPHGNLWKDDFLNSRRPTLLARGALRDLQSRWAIRRADAVISIGDPVGNRAGLGRRIVQIPNAVRTEFSVPMRKPTCSRALLVPCAVKRVKGIERVLRAAHQIASRERPVHVWVAGPIADESYFRELRDLQGNMSAVSVQWCGALDGRGMVDAMDSADCVVLGSSFEVSPVSVGEALMRGRGVAAPDLPGIRYLVDGGRLGALYRVGDTDALARAIEGLLSNRSHEDAAARREWAEQHFGLQNVAEQTAALYRLVTSEGCGAK
jgi:glycosyltransferase involved in cell wall biosynthesis